IGPAAAPALAWALLFRVPAELVICPVVLTPVPSDVPAAPVVAPAPTPPPAVPPTPAARTGSAISTAPHSTAETQALFSMLFMIVSFQRAKKSPRAQRLWSKETGGQVGCSGGNRGQLW